MPLNRLNTHPTNTGYENFILFIISGMSVVFADPITTQDSSEDKIHFIDEKIMIIFDISNNQDTQ